MLVNLEKFSVMPMEKRNQELSYEMEGKVLKMNEDERDLGVIMLVLSSTVLDPRFGRFMDKSTPFSSVSHLLK